MRKFKLELRKLDISTQEVKRLNELRREREEEARELFENMLGHRNTMGLLSEDLDPTSGELWGNFPQTYSMVGIINAARRLSRNWEEEL